MQENLKKLTNWFVLFCTIENNINKLLFFRTAVALLTISYSVMLFDMSYSLYGEDGFIRLDIGSTIRTVARKGLLNIDISFLTSPLMHFTGISENYAIKVVIIFYIFMLLLMIINRLSGIASLLAWLINTCLLNSFQSIGYGYDVITNHCLFMCVCLSTNKSASKRNLEKEAFITGLSVRLLQLYLCTVYFFSGLHKILSEQWVNGEAIWRATMQPPLKVYDLSWASHFPIIFMGLSIGVIVLETMYPILMSIRKIKKITFFGIILMHIGIGIFMHLWFFALIMITLNVSIFGLQYIENYFQFKNIVNSFHKQYATKRLIKHL